MPVYCGTMQDLLYRMVERMLRDRALLSRNKNFDAFDDPRLRHASGIVRHLRALEADILRFGIHGDVARGRGGKYRFEIRMDELKGTRVAHLNARELALLCINPSVERLLTTALGESIPVAP